LLANGTITAGDTTINSPTSSSTVTVAVASGDTFSILGVPTATNLTNDSAFSGTLEVGTHATLDLLALLRGSKPEHQLGLAGFIPHLSVAGGACASSKPSPEAFQSRTCTAEPAAVDSSRPLPRSPTSLPPRTTILVGASPFALKPITAANIGSFASSKPPFDFDPPFASNGAAAAADHENMPPTPIGP
jgi:hypothetical protein